jgi:hypothetical protein
MVLPQIGMGALVWDNYTAELLLHYTNLTTRAILQVKSRDAGLTWSPPLNLSAMLAPDFAPSSGAKTVLLTVGPGAGLQLSGANRFHPGRLLFAGHHGAYEYDVVYFSDDHGETWQFARNESGRAAWLLGLDEPALAETPVGGVILRARNQRFHGAGKCNCRGTAESTDGGDHFFGGVSFDAALPEPICQGSMLNDLPSGKIFSAMPGFGTEKEQKDALQGRGNGVVRWSVDGGKTWPAAMRLWQGHAFSYSCLTRLPLNGFIGLSWETVLPDSSSLDPKISANNILFSRTPTNFTSQDIIVV